MNSTLSTTARFATAMIKCAGAGVQFADGTLMLRRQGIGDTGTVGIFGVGVCVSIGSSDATLAISFEERAGGPQHNTRAKYKRQAGDHSNPFPAKLVDDLLDRIEELSKQRPLGVHQQLAAYMYGMGEKSPDIHLLRLRYDSATRTLVEAGSGNTVARLTGRADYAAVFSVSSVEVVATDASTGHALEQALRQGFYECDTARGIDYCMRRLTWLASAYYEELQSGALYEAFVLNVDVETPGQLSEHAPHLAAA